MTWFLLLFRTTPFFNFCCLTHHSGGFNKAPMCGLWRLPCTWCCSGSLSTCLRRYTMWISVRIGSDPGGHSLRSPLWLLTQPRPLTSTYLPQISMNVWLMGRSFHLAWNPRDKFYRKKNVVCSKTELPSKKHQKTSKNHETQDSKLLNSTRWCLQLCVFFIPGKMIQ